MADLDPRQQAAVDAGPCDLFIAAAAGSGKTRVLTERFVSAVLGQTPYEPCRPDEIAAVTFTEKAAGELQSRIRAALTSAGDMASARSVGDAWISTIHGMCSRILHHYAFDAGIDPHFTVLDEVESSVLEAAAIDLAARDLIAADGGVALFDAYGFTVVADAARNIRASVSALAMSPGDIMTISARATRTRMGAIAAELRELLSSFAALRSAKTVDANAEVIRRAAGALEELVADAPISEDALTRLSTSGTSRRASIEGLDELVEAARLLIDEARECASQLLVAPLEAEFLDFLRLFDRHYAALKEERGALDFEDLQTRTLALLEAHPEIGTTYRAKFKMVMLDEFQDTNALQLRIVEHLTSGNLCTVGDENQSIYRFRHADVGVFRARGRQVDKRAELDTNYRSVPELLDAVNAVFSHPALLGPDFMRLRAPETDAQPPGGVPPFSTCFLDLSGTKGVDAQTAEAECIADRVTTLLGAGEAPGSIAILMRAIAGGRGLKVERALAARGVPSYLSSGGGFFECPEIVEARALLAVVNNVWDDAALVTTLASRLTGLDADALLAIRRCADALESGGAPGARSHLWQALSCAELALEHDQATALARLVSVVQDARQRRGIRPLGDTVLQPLLALGADLTAFAAGREGARAWSNIRKLVRLATEYERATSGDLGGFLEYLATRESHSTSEREATLDGELDAVRIMTIHAAKGLEFPHVIVGALSTRSDTPPIAVERVEALPLLGMRLPAADGLVATASSALVSNARRSASDAEAIRLLYVACTRACRTLTVVARTECGKAADGSLPGLLRSALGFDVEGTLMAGSVRARAGTATVRVDTVALAPVEPVSAESVSGGVDSSTGQPATTTQEATPSARSVPPDAATAASQTEASQWATPAASAIGTPHRVSYTGLATYGQCAYRFYLTSIAGLPAPPAAQEGQALAFGSAVHAVLERCRTGNEDREALIDAVVRTSGLGVSAVARLRDAVDAYLAMPVADEVFSSDRVMREAPIAVPVGSALLAGAIDLIAWQGTRVIIVDYKTGAAPLTDAEATERYRLQADCYALAALGVGATSARVVFSELERRRETSYVYDEHDKPAVTARIVGMLADMAERGYPPRDTYDAQLCETCPGLGGMCPVTRPSPGASG